MTWLCDLNDHRTALSFHNGSLGGICGGRSVGRESCQRVVVPGCNVTCRRSYTTRITSLLNITRWSLLHLFMDLTEISRMKIGLHRSLLSTNITTVGTLKKENKTEVPAYLSVCFSWQTYIAITRASQSQAKRNVPSTTHQQNAHST